MATEENDNRVKYLQGQPIGLTPVQKFNLVKKVLKSEFPTEYPMRVRRLNRDDPGLKRLNAVGYTWLANAAKPRDRRYFIIGIYKGMSLDQQIHTLVHEWAHALTWDLPESKSHGKQWADVYGRIYRRIIED